MIGQVEEEIDLHLCSDVVVSGPAAPPVGSRGKKVEGFLGTKRPQAFVRFAHVKQKGQSFLEVDEVFL